MTAELLSRIQFGLTSSFHFIFPPLSLGLGMMLLVFGVQSVRTGDTKWRQLSLFWVKVYGLVFALGVATGIVQEFQFGTNWSTYSRFVGNVFGSLLAAEGIFAFMLEGGFLGLMLFGGARLGNRLWLFATSMVVAGAHFSALWIVMANSWMQTPAGYEVRDGPTGPQAYMTSFADVVFTPSFVTRLLHVLVASWMVGAALVMSVGAWYRLKGRHEDVARSMLRLSVPVFAVLAVLQAAVFGANQATEVSQNQKVKLAAMEGVWETDDCVPMYVFGWVDEADQTTKGVAVPCLLSILVGKSPDTEVQGITATAADDRPPVNLVFQAYHLMIDLGSLFVIIGAVGVFLVWRRKLFDTRWFLWVLVFTVVLTELATLAGWWTAEFGRQPWIVWEELRTLGAASPNVTTTSVAVSLIGFALLYTLLLGVFLWLLDRKIREGPEAAPEVHEVASLPDSFGEIFRGGPRASDRVG